MDRRTHSRWVLAMACFLVTAFQGVDDVAAATNASPPIPLGGYAITHQLWAGAVLETPGSSVILVWKIVGAVITPSGDQVISGYFYADPEDFSFGSPFNPEVFVKIYIAANGWCHLAFNHVTVDPVTVTSALDTAESSTQTGTASLSNRLVLHQYDGVSRDDTLQSPADEAMASFDAGYAMTPRLWVKAVLQSGSGPVDLVWKAVGKDTTPAGDQVISGYLYANPEDFAYGGVFNPEVFVKVYITVNGWANIAFNHVTVDPVDVYTADQYAGTPHRADCITLDRRLSEHSYTLDAAAGPLKTLLTMTSRVVGVRYSVSVGLPPAYDESGTPHAAVFLLDGDYFFSGFYNGYDQDDTFILIGINNSDRRNIDYLPANTCEKEKGGSAAFLDFLTAELVPYLDYNYHIDPRLRLLLGHSHGGSFVFYTLFTDHGQVFPLLFANDASLQCWSVSALEQGYFYENSSLPVIFYAAGASEGNAHVIEPVMGGLLKRHYTGLVAKYETVQGSHDGILNTAIDHGLDWIVSQVQGASGG